MTEKIKCKSCGKILKQEDLEYKVGDAVIIEDTLMPLSNSGIIEPFCKKCIIELLGE